MRRFLPTVLAWLAILILTTTVSGANRISVDAGYVHTSSDNYSSGLVYGASIREGTKRLAFGIGAHRFANSISYEKDVKSGGGTTTHRYEETFRDFFVTILVYVHFPLHKNVDRLLLGCGPQVHFLTATKQYILEKYSETVRDSRLGIQLSARYERIFPFLGGAALIVATSYSWVQSGEEVIEAYTNPVEPLSILSLMVGLGFAF